MKSAVSFQLYLARHLQVALNSLGRLYRAPFTSLMTTAVLGIAMALPTGLYLLTDNLQHLTRHWDSNANLSLFLRQDISVTGARQLADKLRNWEEIETLQVISPEQALDEFRQLSGFGEILDTLDENPLPTVLAIKPIGSSANAASAASLLERLRGLSEVEFAQIDLQWVKRFNAIVNIIRRSIWILASLLGLAVLLIVGNTIRLEIQNRREEIEITRLIGATNSFIRRPFLYSGLWYGLIGAIIGGVMVQFGLWQLRAPVAQLASLYNSSFSLQTFSIAEALLLLLTGTVLGLIGAWLAVGRHLAAIEPR